MEDKDKTPIVSSTQSSSTSNSTTAGGEAASSTISRLESKYCDILDRVHRRKEKDKDDKEKTLEPERTPTNFGSRGFNSLAKSATTASVRDESFSSALKERTPYRLATQRSRNKFLESIEMDYYKKRAELSLAYGGGTTSKVGSAAVDSLYERNGREPSSSSKYVLKPRSKDSGYYDGKTLSIANSGNASGKENIFKSKYDPDELLSELNNSSILSGATSKARRHIKPCKRSDTTDINFLLHSTNTTSNILGASDTSEVERKKENRRSGNFHHLQRSATQGYFDADDICTVPISSDDDLPSDDPRQIERDYKRKEIESILQKYAPLDDKKTKDKKSKENSTTTANPMASEHSPESTLSRIKSPTQHRRHHQRSRHHYESVTNGGLQKSYTITDVTSHLNGNGLYNGNSSIQAIQTGALSTLYKQKQQQLQHQLLMRSSRSRIPKALSTFVRICPRKKLFACILCECV